MARISSQFFALAALATPGFSSADKSASTTCPTVGCVNTKVPDDQYATALGMNTTATSYGALAAGRQTLASGGWSAALGRGTEATNVGSLAVGGWNKATGKYSFAGGRGTTADGPWSFAFGENVYARFVGEAVFGRESETDCKDPVADPCGSGSVFRIGAGQGIRRDAFKVDPFGMIAIKRPLYPWCQTDGSNCDADPIFDLHKEMRELRSNAAEVKTDVDRLKGGFTAGMTIMSLTIVALLLHICCMRRQLKALRRANDGANFATFTAPLGEPMLQNQQPSAN